MRQEQDAQKSSTRPEEGELEFELGWSDLTPANQQLESRRQKLPAVNPVKWQHGLDRIADNADGVETRQWSPVPLGAFEANTDQRASNGLQLRQAVNAMDGYISVLGRIRTRTEVRATEWTDCNRGYAVASAAADGSGSTDSQAAAESIKG